MRPNKSRFRFFFCSNSFHLWNLNEVTQKKEHNSSIQESFNKWSVKWFDHLKFNDPLDSFNFWNGHYIHKAFVKTEHYYQMDNKRIKKVNSWEYKTSTDQNMALFTWENDCWGLIVLWKKNICSCACVCLLCVGLLLFIDWERCYGFRRYIHIHYSMGNEWGKIGAGHQQIVMLDQSIPNHQYDILWYLGTTLP